MSTNSILKRAYRYIIRGIPENIVKPTIIQPQVRELLKGKSIIITGGSRGLGLAMARKFTDEGAKVLISGRSEDTLRKISAELNCLYLPIDISNTECLHSFIRKADEMLEGANLLVNNAGISLHEHNFEAVTLEGMSTQLSTNLVGPFFLTQEFIKCRTEKKSQGNVLFISSETGDTADIRPYGLTKAAINSLVQGLAHAYKLKGIRVNAIAPGITATDMTGVSADNLYAGSYGAGRFYLPDEIAEVASFLVSDVSSCISGQIITCNNAETVNARWKK